MRDRVITGTMFASEIVVPPYNASFKVYSGCVCQGRLCLYSGHKPESRVIHHYTVA